MSLTTDFIGKQTQQSQGLSPRAARLVVLAGLLAFWASFALVLKVLL